MNIEVPVKNCILFL